MLHRDVKAIAAAIISAPTTIADELPIRAEYALPGQARKPYSGLPYSN
jgi:hypothetical protein